MTLSTVVHTAFGDSLLASEPLAISDAQALSDQNGSLVGIWKRDGWYTVCEVAPELIEPDPELSGWRLWAVVDPTEEVQA